MNEAGGSESIRAENVFHKHTDRSGKLMQGIGERYYVARDHMWNESI